MPPCISKSKRVDQCQNKFRFRHWQPLWLGLVIAAFVASLGLSFAWNDTLSFSLPVPFAYLETKGQFTAFVLACPIVSITLVLLVIDMVKALKEGHMGVDVLALLSLSLTLFVNDSINGVVIGGYLSSLAIAAMIATGQVLESYANRKAESELGKILDRSPKVAHRIDGENKLSDCPIESIPVGTAILVKPGEIVPIDGLLLSAQGIFDTSSITGEADPRLLCRGETVYSGYVALDSLAELKTTRLSASSQYQTIAKIVSESTKVQSRFIRVADRYAIPFTLLSLGLGVIAWLIAYFSDVDYTPFLGLTRFTDILVLASPCPLLIAVPIAFVSGKSKAASQGIIFKESDALEKLAKAKAICFDKTGTLTKGNMALDSVAVRNAAFSKERLLIYAKSLEFSSNHILAKALEEATPSIPRLSVTDFKETIGQGVEGRIGNDRIKVGRSGFADVNPLADPCSSRLTSLWVSVNGVPVGCLGFRDETKPDAKETIRRLKAKGIQRTVLITGDRADVAESLAKEANLDEVHAECLPMDKLRIIDELKSHYSPLAMVGDGVNDAPSIQKADVGLAYLKGAMSLTGEAASVALLNPNAISVYLAFAIAKKTMAVARNAVWLGMSLCLGAMLVALTGVIPSVIGAGIQEAIDAVSISYALAAMLGYRPLAIQGTDPIKPD